MKCCESVTDARGAGMFVFPVPAHHDIFSRPGIAAEASLKTALLHDAHLVATPSGHQADVTAFSTSLEYLFLEARPDLYKANSKLAAFPLALLTQSLRSFSGDASLRPQRSVATGGRGLRRGRKRLAQWPEDPVGAVASDLNTTCENTMCRKDRGSPLISRSRRERVVDVSKKRRVSVTVTSCKVLRQSAPASCASESIIQPKSVLRS